METEGAHGTPTLWRWPTTTSSGRARGPGWDPDRGRRDQDGWDEHAAFVDALAEEGIVVLAGPLGEDADHDVLLVADVESEAAIRARLADDPWMETC